MRKNFFIRFVYNLLLAIATGVIGAIACSWPLLALLMKLQKTNALINLPIAKVMQNYSFLLQYLLFPWKQHLQMPDLPTSVNAAEHFYECKLLFQLALIAFLIGLVLAIYARWRKQTHFMSLEKGPALTCMLLPFIVLPFALVDFDEFFVIFHQIFFHNSNWLFNPQTDPIINVLTEGFFAACFSIFVIIYELYFARFLLKRK